ncbi:MAG: RNA 2',3'-cyclic phosphodiesterase [Hyphomicrobiaceae bacterium]|nr:RNA 2',3'-cyclic phosphodiesterase [Hyphomicrobiaceae bacterium]
MSRLFAALALPNTARTHLSLMRGEIDAARWISADNMHLTLRFFGDITSSQEHDIIEALDGIDEQSLTLNIKGAAAFGGNSPTTIYAVVEPTLELLALQRAIERAVRPIGLPPEPRPFVPHVTLARLRHGRPRQIAHFLEDAGHMQLDPIHIEEFALMSARPGTGGGPYGIEATFPLR